MDFHKTLTVLVLCLTVAVAASGVVLVPEVIGSLSRQGVGGWVLGLLGFLEAGGNAVGAFACSVLVKRFSSIRLCQSGALLLVVSNLVCATATDSIFIILFGRAFAGLGGGMMYAGGLVAISKLDDTGRGFAWMTALAAAFGVTGYLVGPYLANVAAGRGVFYLGAGLGIMALLGLFARSQQLRVIGTQFRAPAAGTIPGGSALVMILASLTFFLYSFSDVSLWSFIIPFCASAGLSIETASHFVVVGSIGQVAASALGGMVTGRFGPGRVIVISLSILALCSVGLVHLTSPMLIGAVMFIRLFFIAFICPAFLVVFSRKDPSGRALAATTGAINVGYALGNLASGGLMGLFGGRFELLGWFSFSGFAVCLLLSARLLQLPGPMPRSHPAI